MIATLRESLRAAWFAARVNFLPGLLLQGLMAVFLLAYLTHEGTRDLLAQVALLKQRAGFGFTFASYVIAGALLPELLTVAFFQKGRVMRANLWRFATAGVIWGCMGVSNDVFYRCQSAWFGSGNAWPVVMAKVLVDQFIYSPFWANPVAVGLLTWRNAGFAPAALGGIVRLRFYLDSVIPVQVAGWGVWIPAVSLVYFMPPALQIPVAALVQAFWALILTTVNERPRARIS